MRRCRSYKDFASMVVSSRVYEAGHSRNAIGTLGLSKERSRDVHHEDRQMEINCVIALDLSSSADSGPRAMHTVNGPIGSSGPYWTGPRFTSDNGCDPIWDGCGEDYDCRERTSGPRFQR